MSCFHVSVCLSALSRGEMVLRGRLEKCEMKEKRKTIVSYCDTKKENYAGFCESTCMCVCVCALKREYSCAEHTGRGETLFLPSSYFLLNSCVSLWEGA